jgi:hypothetical protein
MYLPGGEPATTVRIEIRSDRKGTVFAGSRERLAGYVPDNGRMVPVMDKHIEARILGGLLVCEAVMAFVWLF